MRCEDINTDFTLVIIDTGNGLPPIPKLGHNMHLCWCIAKWNIAKNSLKCETNCRFYFKEFSTLIYRLPILQCSCFEIRLCTTIQNPCFFCQPLTCGPSYFGLTRPISWLIMSWLLMSPEHQQPWYCLCSICRSWSYLRKDFKYLYHINKEEWHKM